MGRLDSIKKRFNDPLGIKEEFDRMYDLLKKTDKPIDKMVYFPINFFYEIHLSMIKIGSSPEIFSNVYFPNEQLELILMGFNKKGFNDYKLMSLSKSGSDFIASIAYNCTKKSIITVISGKKVELIPEGYYWKANNLIDKLKNRYHNEELSVLVYLSALLLRWF